ncbi:hypothetical protein [Enterococcus sp. DIV0756]|uniref:hypothetical protein n=1 Tax=Enterococcus sp. DIV0756 TaxID=2774636 RepID=UPI003F23303C
MSVKKLSSRQIFGVKRESVERRIEAYFEETNDGKTVVQYAFALLLRNALSVTDFSGMLATIIQQIFLSSQPDDTLCSLAPFFKSYFSGGEWENVVTRLFGNKKNYHAYDATITHYKKYVFEKTTPIDELRNQQYKYTSVFLKENGETHTWSMRDADPNISEEKFQAIIELLSMLTVFEKDGNRLFVEVVSSDLMNCTRRSLIKKKKAPKKNAENEEPEIIEEKPLPFGSTLADLIRPAESEEEEMKITLPAGIQLEDLSEEELLKIVTEQLPEGATLTGLRLDQKEDSQQETNHEPTDVSNQQSDSILSAMSTIEEPPKQKGKQPTKSLVKKNKEIRKRKKERSPENELKEKYFKKRRKSEIKHKKKKR